MPHMAQTNIASIITSIGSVNLPFSNIGLFEPELILFDKNDRNSLNELVLLALLNEH